MIVAQRHVEYLGTVRNELKGRTCDGPGRNFEFEDLSWRKRQTIFFESRRGGVRKDVFTIGVQHLDRDICCRRRAIWPEIEVKTGLAIHRFNSAACSDNKKLLVCPEDVNVEASRIFIFDQGGQTLCLSEEPVHRMSTKGQITGLRVDQSSPLDVFIREMKRPDHGGIDAFTCQAKEVFDQQMGVHDAVGCIEGIFAITTVLAAPLGDVEIQIRVAENFCCATKTEV